MVKSMRLAGERKSVDIYGWRREAVPETCS